MSDHHPVPGPVARLRAKLADPVNPPFHDAVALTCEVCSAHITWVNAPAPPVPVRCAEHPAPGRLNRMEWD